ncbi:hydrolase [Hahella sp. CCB-MM4]|uniref:TIGR01458 family HAD-type hydrolase n=1 Tax=Hahella sp. (strain CCB-MM4) TaxID=1926491 RepID=UPI000B9BE5B8|nr:TIGR01458 family HAD-type hydrolase [Hahella sp. CCB-MM4]OZG71548.1 hydrolase [Hahella sp. CCB-MM4]
MTLPFKALLLDLSGVLYEGTQPIPGASDFVRRARDAGLILRFVTNTASRPAADVLSLLQDMNIHVEPEELFTAPLAAKRYIQHHGLRPYCLVHEAIRKEFEDLDQSNPDCVLLGDARDDLNYANLNHAFRICMQGAPLIGIGLNKYFKDDEGLMLDAGPFIQALEWATDTQAVIMGKPSKAFFEQVVDATGFPPRDCLMVGDDVLGDVEGAVRAGLQGCLVKTGKFQSRDLDRLPETAQVIDSIADLL